MAADFPYRILSTEQMQLVQQSAQDFFLQLKEADAWERHCSSEPTLKFNKEKSQATKSSASLKESQSLSKSSLLILQKDVKKECLQITKVKKDIPNVSDIVSNDLKFIKSKLNCLQSDLIELKKHKNEKKEATSDYYKDMMPRDKHSDSWKRMNMLHEALQSSLAKIAAEKNKQETPSVANPMSSRYPALKPISFQMPYVLKEQKSLVNRFSVIQSIPRKKTLPKKKLVTFNNRLFTAELNSQKQPRRPTTQGDNYKEVFSVDNRLIKGSEIDGIVEQIMEKLLEEGISDFRQVKASKKKFIKDHIEDLTKQITEIEKAEELVRDKWKSRCMSELNVTYSKPLFGSNQRSEFSSLTFAIRPNESSKTVLPERSAGISQETEIYQSSEENKSLCTDNTNAIFMHPSTIRNIQVYKGKFEQYVTANYPYFSMDTMSKVTEFILQDCVQDIATELQNLPQSFIQEMYDHEFIL